MRFRTVGAVAALGLAVASMAFVPVTFAQTPAAPSEQDHKAHHPEGAAPAQPGSPAQGGMMGCPMMAGMMGQQADAKPGPQGMRPMMPMMQNMMAMMSAETGMMMPHVEGRLAALKTELKITEAQAAQWNRFADALRATAKSMNQMHQPVTMQQDNAAKVLPDRLAAREQAMSAHLAALQAEREALQPLYAAFSDEQKRTADALKIGPMGMM